jgi:hypothetical protein
MATSRRWSLAGLLVAVGVAASLAVPNARAQTPPSLFLERLDASSTVVNQSCDVNGTSTLTFTASGTATGPYAGPFTESGTLTMGPQNDSTATLINGSFGTLPVGVVTSSHVVFHVDSPTGQVDGETDLVLPGSVSQYFDVGNCATLGPPSPYGDSACAADHLGSFGFLTMYGAVANYSTYSATISTAAGTFSDSGFGASSAEHVIFKCSFGLPIGGDQSVSTTVLFQSNGVQVISLNDSTPPAVTINTPADGSSYSLGQSVTPDYTCTDDSGVATCTGPSSVDTATAGAQTFTVDASDTVGNSTSVVSHYTVLAGSVTQSTSGGGSVTTDPGGVGPSPAVPVQTSLSLPADAPATTVAVTSSPTAGTAPTGFAFFGDQIVVDSGGVTTTAADPFVVTFNVDASLVGGVAPSDLQVFRDGVPITPCTDPSAAIPDPCIVSQTARADGGVDITVRTIHFSTWNFGRLAYSFTGFAAPVNNMPVVNTTKAGSAIPVKFSLGGNKGLNVFQTGSPSQVAYNCQSGAPTDPVEQTVTAGGSSLSYDSTGYTYVWKTDKAWAGTCRELTLRFRDGTVAKARFSFSK